MDQTPNTEARGGIVSGSPFAVILLVNSRAGE
jgi:hypothetical protein